MDVSEVLQNNWQEKVGAPPMPHMELMTLQEFFLQLEISSEQALEFLKRQGFSIEDTHATTKEIAEKNGVSPRHIYDGSRQATHRMADGRLDSTTLGSAVGR
jgi:hypothetical protein